MTSAMEWQMEYYKGKVKGLKRILKDLEDSKYYLYVGDLVKVNGLG